MPCHAFTRSISSNLIAFEPIKSILSIKYFRLRFPCLLHYAWVARVVLIGVSGVDKGPMSIKFDINLLNLLQKSRWQVDQAKSLPRSALKHLPVALEATESQEA